jgi:pre-mRNA-splicing factor SYF1
LAAQTIAAREGSQKVFEQDVAAAQDPMAAAERQGGGAKESAFVSAKQTAIRNEDVDVDWPPGSQANADEIHISDDDDDD